MSPDSPAFRLRAYVECAGGVLALHELDEQVVLGVEPWRRRQQARPPKPPLPEDAVRGWRSDVAGLRG
jgi:hypothetical protein